MMMSSKVNVLFVLKPVRQAGVEMVLLQAAARLDKRRFRAYLGLLTPDEDHLAPPDLPVINFNLSTLHGPICVKFLLHLGWVIHKYRIQVVHVNSYVPGNYVRLPAGLIGVPLIIDHWHGFTQLSLKRRLICRVLGRFTDLRQAAGSLAATFDGDGQHYPEDLVKLLQKIKSEELALVVGARSKLFHSNLWRMPGKWLLAWLANYLSKTKIPDLNSGLRVFNKEIISRYLHLCPDRFSFSTTSTLVFLNRGYPLAFVPIGIKKRHGESTVSLMTGYETLLLILRLICLFEPLRIFIPASMILVFIGTMLGIYPFFILKRGLTTGSVLVILAGILVFFFGLLADQISSLRKEKYE